MRLVYEGSELHVRFTVPMEVALLKDLARQGFEWVALVRASDHSEIGVIHTQTHCIRLHHHTSLTNRQVVVLGHPHLNSPI